MATQKGKGGKGGGVHAAKKNKYARGAAGSSVKGKNKKKIGGFVTMKNTARKAQKHSKLIVKQQAMCVTREEMMDKIRQKFNGVGISKIQKRFGTLNIHRMTDILSDTFEQSLWYIDRIARHEAAAEQAKVVRKHVKFQKRTKAEKKQLAKNNQQSAVHKVSK